MESSKHINTQDLAFIQRLEAFCQKGDFQKFLQQLGDEHCLKFEDDADEQSLECYGIFQEYVKQLDEKLDLFLIEEKMEAEDMFKICQRAYKADSENLVCLNWILASVEYPKFVAMMLEFKQVIQGGKTWKQTDQDANAQAEAARVQQEYYKSLAAKGAAVDVKDSGKPRVLITGINGYVGSQICAAFLKHGGFQIRGSIRNKSDPKKFNEILKAFGKENLDLIELVDMEILDVPSIERAVAGCKYVVHAACPNPSKAPKNDSVLIKTASEGTTSVLKAAQAAKVKRVVVTCSIASIFMRTEKTHQANYDENDWSNPEMCLNIHHKITYNKELAVWNFIKEQAKNSDHHHIEAVSLILGMCMGPTLVNDHSFTTAELAEQFMMAKVPGVAKMMFPMVDVRDAALAHVRAVEVEEAKDKRIIIVGANIWFKEFAEIIYENFSKFGYKPKTGEIKFWMIKVASWIDDTAKTILPQWDKEQRLSNKLSCDLLGMQYHSYKDTIVEMGFNMIDQGFVKDKRVKK